LRLAVDAWIEQDGSARWRNIQDAKNLKAEI
jgi:hypothetical protein